MNCEASTEIQGDLDLVVALAWLLGFWGAAWLLCSMLIGEEQTDTEK